jgi:ATP-dependent DNA helicase MPH1
LHERDLDVRKLKPFRLTHRRQEIGRDRTGGLMWALNPLQTLERMARAMTHLVSWR